MTKLLKKSLAVVLSVALCLSVMVCGFVASADGEPTITLVANNATPAAGDTVKIDVKVANFDDVAGAQFDVVLGDLALVEDSITSTVDAEFVEAYINVLDGSIRLVNENVDDELVAITTANGVLFSFEVSVPANAAAEDAFTVGFANAKFCEYGEGEPEVDVTAESVTLTVPAAGPVEPTEPDANIAPALFSTRLAISSKLGFYYTFYFSPTIKESLGYEFDDIALKLESDEIDGSTYNKTGETKTVVIDSSCEDNTIFNASAAALGQWIINYSETAMFEQMIEVTPTLYLYNDGALVGYYTFPAQSLADVAVETYKAAGAGETTKKSLIVDFLNMGAAAQEYFDEKVGGGTYIGSLDLPNDTNEIDQSFATDYSYTEADKAFEATDTDVLSTKLQMLTAPTFYYTFFNTNYKTPADVTINISYTSKALNGAVTDEFKGSELPADKLPQAQLGLYTFGFDKIALYDADKVVTCTVSHTGGSTWTYTRTLNSFIYESLEKSTGKLYNLYDAVASFSASTRNHWPNY